jgi:EamA domain-containing membrane protein RarD
MTTTESPYIARTQRAAAVITEVTSPTVLAPALLIVVAIHTQLAQHHGALWWGLLAAGFVGALPLAFLKLGAPGPVG